jgi:hypothetical protein
MVLKCVSEVLFYWLQKVYLDKRNLFPKEHNLKFSYSIFFMSRSRGLKEKFGFYAIMNLSIRLSYCD